MWEAMKPVAPVTRTRPPGGTVGVGWDSVGGGCAATAGS